MIQPCEHLDPDIRIAPPLDVCSTCIEIGGEWFHLRQCLACGRTSCCDESPNRHATAHHHETGHPMMRSAEPDEDWRWCFVDELPYVPGPAGYVIPED